MKPVDDEIKWIKYSILKSSIESKSYAMNRIREQETLLFGILMSQVFNWTYKDYSLYIDFLSLASVTYNCCFIDQLEKLCI